MVRFFPDPKIIGRSVIATAMRLAALLHTQKKSDIKDKNNRKRVTEKACHSRDAPLARSYEIFKRGKYEILTNNVFKKKFNRKVLRKTFICCLKWYRKILIKFTKFFCETYKKKVTKASWKKLFDTDDECLVLIEKYKKYWKKQMGEKSKRYTYGDYKLTMRSPLKRKK